jgi:hypothetical protein
MARARVKVGESDEREKKPKFGGLQLLQNSAVNKGREFSEKARARALIIVGHCRAPF